MKKIKQIFYSLFKTKKKEPESYWSPQLMVSPKPTIHKLKIKGMNNNESN